VAAAAPLAAAGIAGAVALAAPAALTAAAALVPPAAGVEAFSEPLPVQPAAPSASSTATAEPTVARTTVCPLIVPAFTRALL
jgi:hypothetical protein